MKITKTNLRKMIKEELSAVMSEDYFSQSAAAKKLADELAAMSVEELKAKLKNAKSSLFGTEMADSYGGTNYAAGWRKEIKDIENELQSRSAEGAPS